MADDRPGIPAPDRAVLPEDWDAGDPEPLVPGHAARRAELEPLDAALAAFYDRAARGLAAAEDAAALKQRQILLLGRERGAQDRQNLAHGLFLLRGGFFDGAHALPLVVI